MTLHAVWVHGTSVRAQWVGPNLQRVAGPRWDSSIGDIDWTDINGFPLGWGTTFRGKRSVVSGIGGSLTTAPFDVNDPFRTSQKGYWFHFAIPTPVVVAGRRSKLVRVFTLWETRGRAAPVVVHIYDGLNPIGALPFTSGARGLVGRGGVADLQEGATMFTLPSPHEVLWSVGLSVGVAFPEDGEITFVSAGADFDV